MTTEAFFLQAILADLNDADTYWSGYRIVPLVMEFWRDRPFRLHERFEFRRTGPGAPWVRTQLYP